MYIFSVVCQNKYSQNIVVIEHNHQQFSRIESHMLSILLYSHFIAMLFNHLDTL